LEPNELNCPPDQDKLNGIGKSELSTPLGVYDLTSAGNFCSIEAMSAMRASWSNHCASFTLPHATEGKLVSLLRQWPLNFTASDETGNGFSWNQDLLHTIDEIESDQYRICHSH